MTGKGNDILPAQDYSLISLKRTTTNKNSEDFSKKEAEEKI